MAEQAAKLVQHGRSVWFERERRHRRDSAARAPSGRAAARAAACAYGGTPAERRRFALATAAWLLLLVVQAAQPTAGVAAECGGARKCRCGDHVVADYTMTEDLGPCDALGLRVRRAVLLDGDGHLVRGRGARGSFGVQIDSRGSGSRIRNLAVTGFERGLRLVKAEAVRIEAVAAHGNGDVKERVGYGIDLAGGSSRNILDHVQVFANADEGIHVGSAAHENRIVDSEIHDNGRENVYFLRNHGNVLARSTLRGAATAVYIKHAARTVLEGNRIEDGVVHVRGDSRDTRLLDNVVGDGAVVLQRYTDADAKIGTRAPSGTLVRGGRIVGQGVCVRVEAATGTTLEDVALACPQQVAVDDATVTAVASRVEAIRCIGPGRVARARRVEVRFVGPDGAPVPGVEIHAGWEGAATVVANAKGIYSGLVVESLLECPEGRVREAPPLVVRGAGRTRKVAVSELRGDVRI